MEHINKSAPNEANTPVNNNCHKCGDGLTGHEDETNTLCRWCVTGRVPENANNDLVYNENGQLVYG